jgi:hypothetical protein
MKPEEMLLLSELEPKAGFEAEDADSNPGSRVT